MEYPPKMLRTFSQVCQTQPRTLPGVHDLLFPLLQFSTSTSLRVIFAASTLIFLVTCSVCRWISLPFSGSNRPVSFLPSSTHFQEVIIFPWLCLTISWISWNHITYREREREKKKKCIYIYIYYIHHKFIVWYKCSLILMIYIYIYIYINDTIDIYHIIYRMIPHIDNLIIPDLISWTKIWCVSAEAFPVLVDL